MNKKYVTENQEGITVVEHIPEKGLVRCIETTHHNWSVGECVSDKDDGSDGCKWVNLDNWEEKIEKPAKNKTGLGWWIVFTAAFLGSLFVEIASLYW